MESFYIFKPAYAIAIELMYYKGFSVSVIVRVIILLATMIGMALIFGRADLFFNQIILGLLLIFQVYELLRYVNQTNRDLAKFILSIKNADFTVHFTQKKADKSFRELHQAFREITESYKKVKIEKEVQFQYLEHIVKHITVGIISLKGDDAIALINRPAMDILQISHYSYWRNLHLSNADFVQEVEQMREGESKLLEVPVNNEIKRLSTHVSRMVLLGQSYKIITFQDIENEINQNEIEAWNKLIRILTHEIMNSITPIASLTETMQMMIENEQGGIKQISEINQDYLADLAFSLKTIQKRSDGLLQFVEDYRKLTKIPVPQIELLSVKTLFETVTQLMRGEMRKRNIRFQVDIKSDDLRIEADNKLIEQVLINLLTNSMHAVAENSAPEIKLLVYQENQRKVIEISDNGEGIEEDKLDKIFIPFFSTKEGGSGIGLSLSKHIMTLHKGNIKVNSQPGQTSFYLIF